jgi:hypothetical protein
MKFEVIKPFGNFKVGKILDSENKSYKKIIKRKLQEGRTIQELKTVKENKMNKKVYEDKSEKEENV